MWDYEQALCPQCGQLRSICEQEDVDYFPQLHWCGMTQARTMANRKWHDMHEKAKPDASGAHPIDGRMVWVSTSNLTPDDMFLG